MTDTSKVNRVEVINYADPREYGSRVYAYWRDNLRVELALQDCGRTLKVFIDRHNKEQQK